MKGVLLFEGNNPLIYPGSGGGEVRRQNGQLWRAVCGIGKSYEVAGARLTRGLFHLLFQVRARRFIPKENSWVWFYSLPLVMVRAGRSPP